MQKIQKPKDNTNTTKPAERKMTEMQDKRGVAANRQGIRYGSRQAGQATDKSQKGGSKNSSGNSKNGGRKAASKTRQ